MDLSDAYRNAAHIPGGDRFPALWAERSAAFRAAHPAERHAYGEGEREWLDLHRPEGQPLGLLLFVHGGYWMAFSPDDFAWVAEGALGRGWAVALPCYPLAPGAGVGAIARHLARAADRAATLVPGPLHLAGHSAGGQAVARLLGRDLPLACRPRIARALPISPVADLRPLLLTDLNATLRLTRAEAEAESPTLHPAPPVPVTVWVGAEERPAFLDQARGLARAWAAPLVEEPGRHHFDVLDGLRGGPLLDAALAPGAAPLLPVARGGAMASPRGLGLAPPAVLNAGTFRGPPSVPGPHPRGSEPMNQHVPAPTAPEGRFGVPGERPATYRFHQGERVLPFAPEEYEARLAGLRAIMEAEGVEAALLTSMHGIAYYSGFLHCSFGRPYGLVVTPTQSVTISAGIDAAQPWRRCHGDNLTYTDWTRDNFWRAVASVTGNARSIGIEGDHLTLAQQAKLGAFLAPDRTPDIAPAAMRQRMRKSPAEVALIRQGAQVADVGGHAIRDAVRVGATELEVAMAGRDAMEREIARRFPLAEFRDTWVWFQSGINTDGAHNPVTARAIAAGDILSLNCFPMISGYYTALERTMFAREVDAASLAIWEANVAAHEFGMGLLRPGATCAEVTHRLNAFLEERGLLQFRTFGYGHSFGVLSHHYGREAGLELREDVDTVLEPGMVVSMEPMLTIPEGQPGAGGYREHDILVITEDGAEDITGYPYGPAFNVVG